MSKYKSALGKIYASDKFKADTIEKLSGASTHRRPLTIKAKAISFLAASLAVITVISLLSSIYKLDTGKKDNSFVLTVNAAEVTENSGTVNLDVNYYAIRSCVKENYYSYEIHFPAQYTGDNIDTISYTINRGGFTFGSDFDPTIIARGIELEHRFFTEYSVSTKAYSSFTIDYESQSETSIIGIVGDNVHLDRENQKYLNYYGSYLWGTNENVIDALLGDIILTSKITFEDGTSKTQRIKVGTKVMKYCEAYPEETAKCNQQEGLFITLKLI